MDFGGFFLFIAACIYCFVQAGFTISARERASRIRARKRLLIAILATFILAWWLYRVYYLDEGLLDACMRHDTAAARTLLYKGANPNATWENGEHVLTYVGDDPSILKLLIAKGADVNARGPNGITVLHNAKTQGYANAVAILRQAGAKD